MNKSDFEQNLTGHDTDDQDRDSAVRHPDRPDGPPGQHLLHRGAGHREVPGGLPSLSAQKVR